jgi:sugar lactone lactonase YvrE
LRRQNIRGGAARRLSNRPFSVTPAQAGVHLAIRDSGGFEWIPAFAGMTIGEGSGFVAVETVVRLNMHNLQCLVEARCGVGESPLWDGENNRLFWTDNTTDEVHCLELATRARRVWHFGDLVGSLGLTTGGRLIVAAGNRIILFDLRNGRRDLLAKIDFPPGVMKLNDGKVGPDGAFWVGSMAERAPKRAPVASLYRVTGDGRVEEMIAGGIMVSNGLAWSPDAKTMYHSDSQGGWIDVWDFDVATGAIGNRRRFRDHDREKEGAPDGAATDIEGAYWSAGFSAGCFNRIAPDGTLIERVSVPAAPTMPAFGGEDMKTLFFTSLTAHVSADFNAKYPLNGSVFMTRVDVAGLPVARFLE